MSSLNTAIYLDVDGVISPLTKDSAPPQKLTGWEGKWGRGSSFGFRIIWSTELIEALNALTSCPDVRPAWVTSWMREAADDLSGAIGLNGSGWPVLSDRGSPRSTWWKLDAIRANITANAPDRVVWLDDDISKHEAARSWARRSKIPILTISPKAELGLTRGHMDRVNTFLDI